jgi:hypothetical protein
MPIQYSEITIIRNIEEENIFRTLSRYFGNENYTIDIDTIIIHFYDDTICDVKTEYIDKNYTFGKIDNLYNKPTYLLNNNNIFYYKRPLKFVLNFNALFKNYEKYKVCKSDLSINNFIYSVFRENEVYGHEVLGLLRLKTNEEKPRYLLAHDDTYFDKSDIVYLVKHLIT